MAEIILRAEKVTRILEGEIPVTLVQDADVEIHAGEFVAITGPSGSGKSSLLYMLGLLDKPTSGRLNLKGNPTTGLSDDAMADLRLAHLGFVFQFHFLLPEFSALENVMLPIRKLGKLPEAEIQAHAKSLLASLELDTQMHKIPRQLSGGQAQRVAIARALANEPDLILADEPTGNLDTKSSLVAQNILLDVAHKQGRAVAIVTHDPEFAKRADRIIKIVDGKIEK